MDQASQDRMTEILRKEPAALTELDIQFLKARRSYLNEEQLANYAKVLKSETQEEEAVEAPKKATKKS